ncbi:MAG: DMT family transporter [Nitratireductor sp.]
MIYDVLNAFPSLSMVKSVEEFSNLLISSDAIMNSSFSKFLEGAAPAIFVGLWSTGFIGGKLGLPYAEPFTFLTLRMAIVLVILVPIVAIVVRSNAGWKIVLHSMVAGVLIHSLYLGGVFYAISQGMSAGIAALIVGLQPLLTAFLAWQFLKENISKIQLIALITALFGVALVVYPKLAIGLDIGITNLGLFAIVVALIGISVGSIYQKYFVHGLDIRFATMTQYVGAIIPLALFSYLFETQEIEWSGEFIFALIWLVFVLSIGAVGMLLFLINRDNVSQTASLFYLVPVCTAIIAYFLFGETLVSIQFLGMVIVIVSVAYGSRKRA